ncbi:Protein ABC1, mitochondrial [Grifola frondosa]|uniref:Protein ABC1, mitochondrial n=1 Tax=Grifola frondosa TaxID=5627 RepID=A0A1C7MEY7_GRIFR|nr:Protein ABC1, mitochondrial [Grifola frondosa]
MVCIHKSNMPPGPAYNWLCVAHSVLDILSNAAQIRAAQISRTGETVSVANSTFRYRKRDHALAPKTRDEHVSPGNASNYSASPVLQHIEDVTVDISPPDTPETLSGAPRAIPLAVDNAVAQLASEATSIADASVTPGSVMLSDPPRTRELQSSKVPSSRIGRLFHYGGLAASLGYGAASELIRRSTSSSDDKQQSSSLMLTEGNIKRLVSKLTQMRGAALKLGQFMSIQDSHILPPEAEDIFRRVQDSAHYMPDWQMEVGMALTDSPTLALSLPCVSASHAGFSRPFLGRPLRLLRSPPVRGRVYRAGPFRRPCCSFLPTGKAAHVAVKIQFPNIVNSIQSDLGYVKILLTAGRLLPKGLFLDRTIQVMKEELADECDYAREAAFLRRFGEPAFLGGNPRFKVPWVWDGSTERVLVMEHVDGVSVGGSVINRLTQQDRNDIATRIIDLCLKELFVFRIMQTDPNWTNFLWNDQTRQVALVDFGATREYTKEFIDNWLRLLQAAVLGDRNECIDWSLKLGYLTGDENEIMLDAHVKSMMLLGTPFKESTPQPVTFGPGSQWAEITSEIRAQIPVMLKHRLTPPPRETYSLNRKLSGAFLLASRLSAEVDCRTLWHDVVDGYKFGDGSENRA